MIALSQRKLFNALLLISLFILGGTSYIAYRQINSLIEANDWVVHTHKAIEEANKLLLYITEAEANATNYLLAQKNGTKKEVSAILTEIQKSINTIRILTADNPYQRNELNELQPMLTERSQLLQQIFQDSSKGHKVAFEIISSQQRYQLKYKTYQKITEIINEELYLLDKRNHAAQISAHQSIITIIFIGIMGEILLLIAIVILNYRFMKQYQAEQEKKKAEDALIITNKRIKKNKKRYELAINASNIGLWSWKIGTERVHYSPNFKKLLGFEAKEFPAVLSSFEEKIHPDDKHLVMSMLKQHAADEEPFNIEYRMITKSNEYHWYQTVGQTMVFSNEKIRRMYGSLIDITERKNVEKMKNEFISVVNHELRTPLTSIHGAVTLLVNSNIPELQGDANQLLLIAKNNCERLIRLISDMLDIEKIETGKMRFHFTRVKLIEIINTAVMESLTYGMKKFININVLDTESPVYVNADRDRIFQVIINLLSNAIKFAPNNSDVTIRLLTMPNKIVRVEITDQGVGIPLEFKDKIFQKFSQADSSDTRKQEGTGLGLNISKAIIEKHGGTIGFTSKINAGTTFYIDLPIFE